MKTYVELKNIEKELLENTKKVREANIQLIEKLNEVAKDYPEEFRILPKKLELINFNKINGRLDIIKEEIEYSSIEDEKKKEIVEVINSIEEKIKTNNQKAKEYEKETLKNTEALQKREELIKEKRPLLEENVRKIASIMKKINAHYRVIGDEQIAVSVKEEAKKVVKKLQEEKNCILREYEGMIRDSNLKDDLDLILSKEKEGLKIDKIKNIDEQSESKSSEKEITQNNIEAVIPEEEQEVVDVHKAPVKLVDRIKKMGKTGKISLGVLIIGAAVAAVIANPLALAAIPAGGLIYNQVKEHSLKK